MDILGGVTGSVLTLLGDAAPVLNGKPLAHFYIGVREIDAIVNGQSVMLGSSSTPAQMDLLAYQNGSANWMTQTNIPSQTYSQLRYVLDMNSTQAIFTDGSTLSIAFSTNNTKSVSGMGASTTTVVDQTYPNAIDVTVNAPFTVGSNAASVMADFNLTESLNQTGNTIVVRPTLSAASASSQISGSVINAYGQPVPGVTVVAVGSNGAAVNSAATDANGGFDIDALGADTYRLAVYNTYTNAAGYKTYASGQTKSGQSFWGPSVSVTAGSNASAGSIGD
jgi:hypothetical protein